DDARAQLIRARRTQAGRRPRARPGAVTSPHAGAMLAAQAAAPLGRGGLVSIPRVRLLPGRAIARAPVRSLVMPSRIAIVLAVAAPFCAAQSPLVNAPVAPEAIYIGRAGAQAGVSVIDCNGFGQGTGNINATRFPLNPNIGQPGVVPPLAPGTSNVDAGSGGALTLVRDSLLNTNLLPAATGVSDMAIGMPLDLVFNDLNINPNV